MDNTLKNPVTVIALESSGFKRLRARGVHIRPPATGVIELHGRNGQGKSAILDSLEQAILNGRAPLEPIFNSEGRADIKVDLGELRIWKRWTDPEDLTKCYLTVENGIGQELDSPAAILKALASKMMDPTKFYNMSGPEQVRMVLSMVDLGIDLDASQREEAAAMQDRAAADKQLAKLAAAVDELAASLPADDTARVDVGALTKELRAGLEHNAMLKSMSARRAACKSDYNAAVLVEKRTQIARAEAEEALAAARAAEVEANEAVFAAVEAGKATRAEWDALPSTDPVDLDALQLSIDAAQDQESRYGNVDRHADRVKELEVAKQDYAAADDSVVQIRWARTEALRLAEFPVEGLGYDNERKVLTYKNTNFSQASQGERIRIAAELAMRNDAQIKVLFCRDGSFLDQDAINILDEVALARGWQVWLEIVDNEPSGVGLWIEDGAASGEYAIIDGSASGQYTNGPN